MKEPLLVYVFKKCKKKKKNEATKVNVKTSILFDSILLLERNRGTYSQQR